jgi:hypothetical protein
MQTMEQKYIWVILSSSGRKWQIEPYENKAKKVSFYSSRSWSDIAHF